MQNNRAGDGVKFTKVGVYMRNNPTGGGIPNSLHLIDIPTNRLPPAESPAATIRSPNNYNTFYVKTSHSIEVTV